MTDRDDGVDESAAASGPGFEPSCGVSPAGDAVEGWPVALAGVTEAVIATLGPNDRWNQAALGLDAGETRVPDGDAVRARTYGRTRTRRNLEERGEGYVQFTRDPVDFVAAALDVHETAAPILESTDAWVQVRAEPREEWADEDIAVVEWELEPVEAAVRHRSVPTLDRGTAAVVEATVAASRLDVPGYDEDALLDRVEWLGEVVDAAGSERERRAFEYVERRTQPRDE